MIMGKYVSQRNIVRTVEERSNIGMSGAVNRFILQSRRLTHKQVWFKVHCEVEGRTIIKDRNRPKEGDHKNDAPIHRQSNLLFLVEQTESCGRRGDIYVSEISIPGYVLALFNWQKDTA